MSLYEVNWTNVVGLRPMRPFIKQITLPPYDSRVGHTFFTERQVFCLGTFVDYGFPFLTYHIRSPLIPLSLDLSLQYSVNYGPNG